jgi:hypothetical protein
VDQSLKRVRKITNHKEHEAHNEDRREAFILFLQENCFVSFVSFYVSGRCQAPCLHRCRSRGSGVERESVTQRSPSIRARTAGRGPQRLCSLNPDHGCSTTFVAVA